MLKKCLCLLLCCISQVMAQDIDKITPTLFSYYTEEYPPSNYMENNELTGASVEILKAMWQDMGVSEQPITVLPWARAYRITKFKPMTMLFAMSRTPEREGLFKWVGPIFSDSHILVARHDFSQSFERIEQAFSNTIATVHDDYSFQTLDKAGFPPENMVNVINNKQALKMIKSGRVELALITTETLERLVGESDLALADFKIVSQLSADVNYFAFNLKTPDKVIHQFQQAFDNTQATREAILRKYYLKH